ncbi:alcohol dehydrogenase catalytic domain-containing protein [Campylobacter lari]|nr:alcohol dehydrogenase catalytic domain-containing protein [Campylobacter lari]
MKKMILNNFNSFSIVNDNVPVVDHSKDEVLIKVKACGVCSSDYSRIFDKGPYSFPLILGHEFCGIVEDKSTLSGFQIGDSVAVFPLKPCFKCVSCKKGYYNRCHNYGYFGSREDGGFQEYIKIPSWNLVPIDNIPYELACLIEPASVALNAINKITIDKNDKVCIIGTGIIGLFIGIFLQHLGLKDIAFFSRNSFKSDLLSSAGFSIIKENLDNLSFDLIFESVGSNESVNLSMQILNSESKLVLTGNPSGDIILKRDCYWKILRNEAQIFGVWNSEYPKNWLDAVEIFRMVDFHWLRKLLAVGTSFEELIDLIRKKYNNNLQELKVVWSNNG